MEPASPQYTLFKDTLASHLFRSDSLNNNPNGDSADQSLEDFTSYLASEAWPVLPAHLHTITHDSLQTLPPTLRPTGDVDEYVATLSLDAVSHSFIETLTSYERVADDDDAIKLLRKVVARYIEQAIAPPPVWSSTRTRECEICEREVPLTYHHLVPRSVQAKALKRGWHSESVVNKVAWLCRPCHTAVHGVASNEELAESYHTVELLLEREDIQRWRKYASKQRFGVRRG